MLSTSPVQKLSQCLAGVFQNRSQALADPAWFVHIRIWMRPIALFAADSHTFFLEQASAAYSQPPYRQRILRIRAVEDDLTAEYYALADPQNWQGAALEPERLNALTEADVRSLSGSRLLVQSTDEPDAVRFEARHYPGEQCKFEVGGETKIVKLAFDAIAPNSASASPEFWMYDTGIDPQTGKVTWGAKNGPFKLIKIEDWSDTL